MVSLSAATVRAYHFTGDTLRDGRPLPADGEWLEHEGPLIMCERGLHASRHPLDALRYAPGPILCLVEVGGEIQEQDDKLVARRRKILKRFDATKVLCAFAREQALSVIHLWDAPPVVRQYLETGDESLRIAARDATKAVVRAAARDAEWDAARDAARDAAWAATCAAAWDAAYAAAGDAACAAAWDAAKDRLKALVDAELMA